MLIGDVIRRSLAALQPLLRRSTGGSWRYFCRDKRARSSRPRSDNHLLLAEVRELGLLTQVIHALWKAFHVGGYAAGA